MELLNKIQRELKAPKGQFNSFGKYHYRNCEDILEAVKPLLGDGVLVLHDEVVQLGERFYVKATATLTAPNNAIYEKVEDGKLTGGTVVKPITQSVSATAYAREALDKKGMDEAQITGAASSYARKYALNGLFCIDDTKDADNDAPKQETQKAEAPKPTAKPTPPTHIAKARDAAAKRIAKLLDEVHGVPFMLPGEYKEAALKETGLELTDENFAEIEARLTAIKAAK